MKVLTRQEEQILLAVYHLKDNAYLVPIREQIRIYTGKYYSVGTIYAPLNRLCVNGFIEAYLGDPNPVRGGKAIKFYRVTEKGIEALHTLKQVHDSMWNGLALPALKD